MSNDPRVLPTKDDLDPERYTPDGVDRHTEWYYPFPDDWDNLPVERRPVWARRNDPYRSVSEGEPETEPTDGWTCPDCPTEPKETDQ